MSTPDLTYGSDATGLIWAYEFIPGEPARPLPADRVGEALATTPDASGRFSWWHFSLANAAAEPWLRDQGTLPDLFKESLAERAASTRLEQDGPWLVAVINDVVFDKVFDGVDEVSTVVLCVGPHALVSARPRGLRSIDRLRTAVRANECFRSAAELLAHLLRDQADVLSDIVRRSSVEIDRVEDNLLRHRLTVSRGQLGMLRRRLVRLQRQLAPEPAALFRLLNRPPTWIADNDLAELRQASEELASVVADSSTLVERIGLIQEELSAMVSEQNNRILYLLTFVTVLAVPFNVVAGLLGMNVGGVPFHDSPAGFLAMTMLATAVTIALAVYMTRKRMD